MDFYNSILIVWMVSSIFITGISSCNISFSTNSALFDLGKNVTLTCKACTIGDGVKIKHNSTEIASYRLNIQLINASLHSAVGQTYGNGSVEVKLTILNFVPSSNGIYVCSTSSSDISTLTLAYTVSTTPSPQDDLSTYREVALASGIIDLTLGFVVTIVTCPWAIKHIYKAAEQCEKILMALFIVWDLGILSSGCILIAKHNSETGFKDGWIIYSLACGFLCVAVLLVVALVVATKIIQTLVCLKIPKQRAERTNAAYQQQLNPNSVANTTHPNPNMFTAPSVRGE